MIKSRVFGLAVLPMTVSLTSGFSSLSVTPKPEPAAQVKSTFEINGTDMRVQILDEDTIRFEYKYYDRVRGESTFEDRNTFLIPARTSYQGVENAVYDDGGDTCTITYGEGDKKVEIEIDKSKPLYDGIKIKKGEGEGAVVVYQTGKEEGQDNASEKMNTGNLPTPGYEKENEKMAFALADYPRVIVPNDGYQIKSLEDKKEFANTCGFEIQDQRDIYVMLYDGSPKKLRSLYNHLAGPSEMVRLATLGAWDSRYYPYNEKTVQLEVDKYHEHNLPLDNFVIDTDWRFAVSGTGYNVNTDLFPDMPRTLANLHAQNLEVAFNDHPEPIGDNINVLEPSEVSNRNLNLQKILNLGLDTWWYDRNWSTSLISPTRKYNPETGESTDIIRHETWGQYLFNDITRQFYQNKAGGGKIYRRPTTMTNLVDVANGTWNGTKDSATHRYSFQWTGDTTPEELPGEITNVVRAGNNSVPYVSSDLAGHTNGVANNYYYSRWIQYGALSPIFRIHCTRDLPIHCQPWYRLEDNCPVGQDEEAVNRFRRSINMRYRLMPLFYQLARENYDTGLPIARSLSLANEQDIDKTKDIENEWMLGNNILFAPLDVDLNNKPMMIESGKVKYANLKIGPDGKHYPIPDESELEKLPYGNEVELEDIRADFSDMDRNHPEGVRDEGYVAKFTGKIKVSQKCKLSYSVDDGAIIIINPGDEQKKYDSWAEGSERRVYTEDSLDAGTYDVTIYYYQNTSGGVLRLNEYLDNPPKFDEATETKAIYLPEGKWYDPIRNNVLDGGELIHFLPYGINESPIFIRMGGMIPLVDNAANTKEIDWQNIYYDIYPTIGGEDASQLYEDDYDTTAYQYGKYRTSDYSSKVTNEGDGKLLTITLGGAKGRYDGDYKCPERAYYLQIHDADSAFTHGNIESVTIDGNEVPLEQVELIEGKENIDQIMPFNVNNTYKDNISLVKVPLSSVRDSHVIEVRYK